MSDHPAELRGDDWETIECERVLYVSEGKERVLCDRLPSPVTLVVKRLASRPTPPSCEVDGLRKPLEASTYLLDLHAREDSCYPCATQVERNRQALSSSAGGGDRG